MHKVLRVQDNALASGDLTTSQGTRLCLHLRDAPNRAFYLSSTLWSLTEKKIEARLKCNVCKRLSRGKTSPHFERKTSLQIVEAARLSVQSKKENIQQTITTQ